eukprot:scaffold160936_cov35-Tisochrysis_lutea.AAC.1
MSGERERRYQQKRRRWREVTGSRFGGVEADGDSLKKETKPDHEEKKPTAIGQRGRESVWSFVVEVLWCARLSWCPPISSPVASLRPCYT